MKIGVKLTALSGILLCLATWAKDPVIYGEDNRKEIYEASPQFQKLASSVAVLIPSKLLISDPNEEGSLQLKTMTFMEWLIDYQTPKEVVEEKFTDAVKIKGKKSAVYPFCAEERFTEQPVGGECTGFLIGPDLIATAGHCSQMKKFCEEFKWVFDYKVNRKNGKVNKNIRHENVYSCKKIVSSALNMHLGLDYALVQLDRKVEGREPLELEVQKKVSPGTPLVVVGHPSGLPMKIADEGRVRSASHPFFFLTTLDTYNGNSGSPVFNAESGLVEGVLVRGEEDFFTDTDRKCVQSNRCKEEGECKGEAVSSMTSIPEISFQNALHTAAAMGDEKTLDQILSHSIWVDIYGSRGITPLMRAAKSALPSIIEKLVAKGADPALSDDRGDTVLHYLAVNLTEKNNDTLDLLLEKGASLEVRNRSGETALLTAARWLNRQAVKLLIQAGADTEALNSEGENFLSPFEKAGDLESVRELKLLVNGPEELN